MMSFTLDGIEFLQRTGKPESRGVSTDNAFVLVKTDSMLRFYEGLCSTLPQNIMEVGMYEGGSLVYFDKLFRPKKLVGLDMRKQPIEALEKYREDRPYIVTYYGRYQDKAGTQMAARENFPHGIDLVVDDASHLYEQTKSTFKLLFPMVRAGGNYVIEDWSWAHGPADQSKLGRSDKPALTNLIFELVVLASQTSAIESIHVDRSLICIRKGRGVVQEDIFDLSKFLRGRTLPLI